MIPVIIIWMILRYREKRNAKKTAVVLPNKPQRQLPPVTSILLIILFLNLETKGYSQNKTLNYQIIRNGNKVGTLRFSETSMGDMDYLKMESDVKTRFIFTFAAHASEEAVYSKGILQHSSIYRRLNGSEKVNKQHEANNRQYIIHAGERSEVAKAYPITYNMLSLYSKEPDGVSRVYSDNFQTFISIENVGLHKYRITLPDGNYNYYYYKKGVLALVEVHHSIYTASIILTN